MKNLKIRQMQPEDNQQVAEVVRKVLVEMGVPKVGTAYEDKALDDMFAEYNESGAAYFVVDNDGEIQGCAGIAPLAGGDGSVAELQKMYFLPVVRGKGIGSEMMNTCLSFAKRKGYKSCYIETLPSMTDAQKLYVRTGFEQLEARMGNTGHFNCSVWLLKEL